MVGGQRHAPSALPPGKSRYSLYTRLGGPQSRSGHVRKISPLSVFDPRTVQPVESRYTDYARNWCSQKRRITDCVMLNDIMIFTGEVMSSSANLKILHLNYCSVVLSLLYSDQAAKLNFQKSLLPVLVDKYVGTYQATRRHIPEDSCLHSYHLHILTSRKIKVKNRPRRPREGVEV